jgi:hypothetical protein
MKLQLSTALSAGIAALALLLARPAVAANYYIFDINNYEAYVIDTDATVDVGGGHMRGELATFSDMDTYEVYKLEFDCTGNRYQLFSEVMYFPRTNPPEKPFDKTRLSGTNWTDFPDKSQLGLMRDAVCYWSTVLPNALKLNDSDYDAMGERFAITLQQMEDDDKAKGK